MRNIECLSESALAGSIRGANSVHYLEGIERGMEESERSRGDKYFYMRFIDVRKSKLRNSGGNTSYRN
tara:strand:+ start:48 stop:251 length:204 start_codon:yes stop_codon:yes gene_type:complete